MGNVNSVAISGNLTADPEVRTTSAGLKIMSLRMASNERRKNPSTGEYENYPNYVDVTLFGNRVDWMSQELHKGSKVLVLGSLRYSSWERDGQKRSRLEVIASEIDFFRDQGQQRQPQQQAQQPQFKASAPQRQDEYDDMLYDESIPF